MHSLVVLENVTYSLYLFNSPQTIYSRLNINNLIKWCNDDIMMTSANYFDAYPLVYYHFSFYPSFFLSFFLSFSLSFFFRPSEVGVGREVDRVCSPGRKEGGKCTGGGSAGSVALSVRKVREKWREPRLKGAGGGKFVPLPLPLPVCPLGPLPIQT